MILKNNLIIARIKGGLGNQLFCYAAAKALSLRTGLELVLDYETGFKRDFTYKRNYELKYFHLPCRLASQSEMLNPFERYRRAFYKFISRFQKMHKKIYIEEGYKNFNLINYFPNKTVILDGLWQNQKYFYNISSVLKNDLIFDLNIPNQIKELIDKIKNSNSVAIHVRWFDTNESFENNNLNIMYYNSAIKNIKSTIINPHFFIFSDNINATKTFLQFNESIVTYASCDTNNLHSIYDMYLMSLCKNFIVSNSTFSWWSAWLCKEINPTYMIPHNQIELVGANIWDPIKDTWRKCTLNN